MRDRIPLRPLLAALLGGLVLALMTGCQHGPSAAPLTTRVLTYNIHHGEGTDGNLDLDRIAAVIRRADPDLVAVQEVDQRTTRTGGVDQAAALAERTGLHVVFGKAMDFAGGAYGQAVLSRWPLEAPEVFPLPGEPGREPRIALLTRVRPPGSPVALGFVSTHFDHERGDLRVASARALVERLRSVEGPVILAGDFNATPDSPPMEILGRYLADAAAGHAEPTIPSGSPNRRIDFVLFAPRDGWRVVGSTVLPEAVASDHRPVQATLQWVR